MNNIQYLLNYSIIVKKLKACYVKTFVCRGISSCVRRCINKKTLEEYAVKIIDLTDKDNQISEELRHVTHNEINILKEVSGQAHISKLNQFKLLLIHMNDCIILIVLKFFCE